MATVKELKEQAQKLTDQAEELLLKAEEEERFTEKDRETMKSLVGEIIDAEAEAAGKERKAEVEQAVLHAENALKKMQELYERAQAPGQMNETAGNVQAEAAKSEETAEDAATPEQVETYIYIGPALQKKNLRAGNCFRGTKRDVLEYLGADKIPNMDKMIVPIADYNKKKAELQSGKTLLSKYYEEMRTFEGV